VRQLLSELKSGVTPSPSISSAASGMADALFDIGLVIGTDDGPELPVAYLRLSTYLAVNDYTATVAMGDVFQSVGRCDEAIKLYEQVPERRSSGATPISRPALAWRGSARSMTAPGW
jgi:hypothetical protein